MDTLDFYRGKRVLITGHTGFKGSWLCRMLQLAGAEITGYSLQPPTEPALFALAGLDEEMTSIVGDVRDFARMVATALQAAEILKQYGISAAVIDPITVKPLDEETILASAAATGAVVTAENHNIVGGLGGAVAELLSERLPTPLARVGVRDSFGQVGNEAFLRKVYGLTAEDIVSAAKRVIAAKK